MLARFTITAKCDQPGHVQGNLGEALHGWLFHQLRKVDTAKADEWHQSPSKPFSVGFSFDSHAKEQRMDHATLLRFSVSTCTEEAFEVMKKVLAQANEVRIGQAWLKKEEVCLERTTTYFDAIMRNFHPEVPKKRTVYFDSPTSFRREGVQLLLPTPELVFGGLYRRFLAVCPHPMPEAEPDFGHAIAVLKHKIQSRMVPYQRYQINGFIGSVEYGVTKPSEEYARKLMNLLLEFASYMGVGYKSTMGLGQIRLNRIANETSDQTRKVRSVEELQ